MFISLFSACFWLHSGCCTFFPAYDILRELLSPLLHSLNWIHNWIYVSFVFLNFITVRVSIVFNLSRGLRFVKAMGEFFNGASTRSASIAHVMRPYNAKWNAAPIRTCKTILAKWYCGCFSCSLASSSVLPASLRLQCRSHAVRTLFRTNNKQMDDQLFALYAGGIAPRKKRNAIDLVCHCTIPIPILNASQIQSMYRFIAWFTVQNIQHNFPLKMRKKLEISRKQH